MLEQYDRVHVDCAAEEATLKEPMVCPMTGISLDGMDAVRKHLCSQVRTVLPSERGGREGAVRATDDLVLC